MRKFICTIIVCLINICTPSECLAEYTAADAVSVIKKIKPSAVVAIVNKDAPMYESDTHTSEKIKTVPELSQVEILEDKTTEWYYVLDLETSETGWVEKVYLDIPEESPVNETVLTAFEIETYINMIGFDSKTESFVFVDIDRQKLHVLSGNENCWKLVKTIICSTGKNESPTVRGLFEIRDRGVWFYSERLQSGAKYWVRFHNTYLFHTLPMDRNKKIIDPTLGEKSSSGCIRMSLEDAEWFYSNVIDRTAVFIV